MVRQKCISHGARNIFPLSLFPPQSYLSGESCLSDSLRRASGERLRALLAGDLALEGGEWLGLDALSETEVEAWWEESRGRGEGLRLLGGLCPTARRCGERFSFHEDASLDGDLVGLLSLSASVRAVRSLPAGDLDLRPPLRSTFGLSSGCGEERLSGRPPLCSALLLGGEGDFLDLSLDLSVLREPFLSLEPPRPPPPRSFGSLPLLAVLSVLASLPALSLDLLLLAVDLLASVESRRPLALFTPLGEMGFPVAALWRCSPFLTRPWPSPSSSDPEL